MKLWVDDIRNAPDDSWTVARTVLSAIRFISMYGEQIKVISLDHDISHQVSIGGARPAGGRPYACEETFESVAHYIALKASEIGYTGAWDLKVIIHTSNPVGATRMDEILRAQGVTIDHKHMGAANRLEMES